MRFFERKSRQTKHAALVHHHRAIFSSFDHQNARPHLENVLSRAQQVVFVGKLARLRIVNHQNVDVFQRFPQLRVGPLDPVIHRVHRGELRLFLDLMQHLALQVGRDIREENVLRVSVFFRQSGLELRKHV